MVHIMVELFPLFLISVFIFIVIYLFKSLKRYNQRAEEKIQLERENTIHLQNKVEELNKRILVLEKILKEVE